MVISKWTNRRIKMSSLDIERLELILVGYIEKRNLVIATKYIYFV